MTKDNRAAAPIHPGEVRYDLWQAGQARAQRNSSRSSKSSSGGANGVNFSPHVLPRSGKRIPSSTFVASDKRRDTA